MFRWKDLKMDFEYTAESTDGTNTALQTVVCWLQCNGSICSCVCRRITNVCGVPTYQCLLISQGWIPSSLISPQSVEGVEECVKEHRWLCGLRWIVCNQSSAGFTWKYIRKIDPTQGEAQLLFSLYTKYFCTPNILIQLFRYIHATVYQMMYTFAGKEVETFDLCTQPCSGINCCQLCMKVLSIRSSWVSFHCSAK